VSLGSSSSPPHPAYLRDFFSLFFFYSHDHPDNAEWSQAAAAELYAALFPEDACPNNSNTLARKTRFSELKKK